MYKAAFEFGLDFFLTPCDQTGNHHSSSILIGSVLHIIMLIPFPAESHCTSSLESSVHASCRSQINGFYLMAVVCVCGQVIVQQGVTTYASSLC